MTPLKTAAAVLLLVQAFAARPAEAEAEEGDREDGEDTAQTVGMSEDGSKLIIDAGPSAIVLVKPTLSLGQYTDVEAAIASALQASAAGPTVAAVAGIAAALELQKQEIAKLTDAAVKKDEEITTLKAASTAQAAELLALKELVSKLSASVGEAAALQVAQSEKLVTVEETTIAVKKILDDDSEGEFTVRCNRETCIAFARTTTSVLRMVWHEHAEVRPCMHTRCSLPTHTFTLTSPPPPYALALVHTRTPSSTTNHTHACTPTHPHAHTCCRRLHQV